MTDPTPTEHHARHMFHDEADAQHKRDQEQLAKFGYTQELRRSLGFFSTFAIAFSFISATNGFYALFYYGLDVGGPAGLIWQWPIIVFGQFMVALVFAEAASHYPLAGGIYQWAKRFMGGTYGWWVAWMFAVALVVTVAAVAFGVTPIVCSLMGWKTTHDDPAVDRGLLRRGADDPEHPQRQGDRLLQQHRDGHRDHRARGDRHRPVRRGHHRPRCAPGPRRAVRHDAGRRRRALSSATAASSSRRCSPAPGCMYGFDTAGGLAEETINPTREVPRAMLFAVGITAVISAFWLVAMVLAIPNVAKTQAQSTGAIAYIFHAHFPNWVTNAFLVSVCVAIFVCCLAIQAATTRLLFAYGRDKMIPGSQVLRLRASQDQDPADLGDLRRPWRPSPCCCTSPSAAATRSSQIARVTAWATAGTYIAYQMVVLRRPRQALQGLAQGQGLLQPGQVGLAGQHHRLRLRRLHDHQPGVAADVHDAGYDTYIVMLSLGVVVVAGAIVYAIQRARGVDLSATIHEIDLGPTPADALAAGQAGAALPGGLREMSAERPPDKDGGPLI